MLLPTKTGVLDGLTFAVKDFIDIEAWQSFGGWASKNDFPFSDSIKESFEFISKIDPSTAPEKTILHNTMRQKINEFLGETNMFCIPTVAEPAPLVSTSREELKKRQYAKKTLALCSIACIADLPQITMPGLIVEGAPIGLSFLMSTQNDRSLLAALKSF